MIVRLDERERIIVLAGMVILAVILIWLVLLNPYMNAMQSLDRRIDGQRRNLERVAILGQEIDQLRQQLAGIESQQRSGRPLFSQVENLTKQIGVREQLLSMRPQPDVVQGGFRQQTVEIRLERVTLSQLVGFLHAAEHRSHGIQVRSLRVRPRFDDRSRLDVNLVLMSLERA
ncbi:MAG: type II secretion system protein M [Desulfuromonadales bacterium]|nr:type II secretion system protein M [Desulfuromonadales bacterium]